MTLDERAEHAGAAARQQLAQLAVPSAHEGIGAARRRGRRRWVALGASATAVSAVVALIAVATALSGTHATTVHIRPAGGGPSPSTSTSVGTGVPGGSVPQGFTAWSVSFPSVQDGWALGAACATLPCPAIVLRTTDRGQTWASIPAPLTKVSIDFKSGVTSIHFADATNGWVFGTELWATHDGGAHWAQPTLAGVPTDAYVKTLATADGTVSASVVDGKTNGGGTGCCTRIRIASSPVNRDDWQFSATIGRPYDLATDAQLVLRGQTGWAIPAALPQYPSVGARLEHGVWKPWQLPCPQSTSEDPARYYHPFVAAADATDLVVVCSQGFSIQPPSPPPSEPVYFSTDGGSTFHPAARPIPVSTNAVADPTPGTVIVEGLTPDLTSTLRATFDGGDTWATVYTAHPTGGGPGAWSFQDLTFVTPSRGLALYVHNGTGGQAVLLLTIDGGRHWSPLPFQSAHS